AAHGVQAPRRRAGGRAALVGPQVDQAAGAADQQPLVQRRGDPAQRLQDAGAGQAGGRADGRAGDRHGGGAADRRLGLPGPADRGVHRRGDQHGEGGRQARRPGGGAPRRAGQGRGRAADQGGLGAPGGGDRLEEEARPRRGG